MPLAWIPQLQIPFLGFLWYLRKPDHLKLEEIMWHCVLMKGKNKRTAKTIARATHFFRTSLLVWHFAISRRMDLAHWLSSPMGPPIAAILNETNANQLPDQYRQEWERTGFPRTLFSSHGFAFAPSLLSKLSLSNPATPRTVCIPASITDLPSGCFRNCLGLAIVTFEPGIQLTSIPEFAFSGYTSLFFVAVPSTVEFLGEECFGSCSSLVTVTFEANSKLRSIGSRAFHVCLRLNSIRLPRSVETLSSFCFCSCASLSCLILAPDGQLSQLGEGFVAGCSALTWISLPMSLMIIDDRAFCATVLEVIQIAADHPRFATVGPLLIDLQSQSLLHIFGRETSVLIPKTVWSLKPSSFSDARSVARVDFEADSQVGRLERFCFAFCFSLVWICIPRSVTSIGERCFVGCLALQTLVFESNSTLRSIGANAFSSCQSLTAVVIPASVQVIHDSCFSPCTSLHNVTFELGSRLSKIAAFAFAGCRSLSSICIPASVSFMHENSFDGCPGLTGLTREPVCPTRLRRYWLSSRLWFGVAGFVILVY
jgi:hypothetical protein